MRACLRIALLLLALPSALAAALVSVSSSELRILGNNTDFWCYAEDFSGRDLLYYDPAFAAYGTSRQIFNLDGNVVDLQTPVLPGEVVQPVTASGSGLGASISMAKRLGNLQYGSSWTIVADPHTGSGSGYVRITSWVYNGKLVPAMVGLRILLDTQLINTTADDAQLSIDNGLSAIDRNTVFQAISGPIPSDWWAYDQFPLANMSARGVTWGNAYGLPASQPDAVEFCHWVDVRHNAQYVTHPNPGKPFSDYAQHDSAVVLWYTNTGQASGNAYMVPAGQTLAWVTYYGINTQPLGATPTPYQSYTPTPTRTVTSTISPTHTISPTFSVSPTISPTHTISPTWSVSPTFSVSPTITQTFTHSPTATATPSASPSFTRTESHTISPTFSHSPTLTATRTYTATPTISQTFTVSHTPTITLSHTISPTRTISPTVTVTPPPDLILTPKPPNPNPSDGSGVWLPYVLSRNAVVSIRVFDVAGERVRDLDSFNGLQGANEQLWDQRNAAGARVASGVFIVHITARADGQVDDAWVKLAVAR